MTTHRSANAQRVKPKVAVGRVIGTVFILVGSAKLRNRRNPPSLVPDWLDPLRPEITAGSGLLLITTGLPCSYRRWADSAG
jgi:hypothetical protein